MEGTRYKLLIFHVDKIDPHTIYYYATDESLLHDFIRDLGQNGYIKKADDNNVSVFYPPQFIKRIEYSPA